MEPYQTLANAITELAVKDSKAAIAMLADFDSKCFIGWVRAMACGEVAA